MAGSIRKEMKKGKWTKKWMYVLEIGKDENGKRKRKVKRGFKSKEEAQLALSKAQVKLNKGILIEDKKFTFAEFLDFWLENYAKTNTAPKTYEGYEYIVRVHLKPSLGNVKLEKLTPLHLQNYFASKLKNGKINNNEGLSSQSIKHHHRLVHKVLSDAVKWGKISRNVAQAVDPPKVTKHEMKTLDSNEVALLMDEAKESQYYPVIFTAIFTGMRRGEILGLRWKDINFNNKTIAIRQTLQAVIGQGLTFKEPKSNKARTISITDNLIKMLKEHEAKQEEYKSFFGDLYYQSDLVFTQANGKPIQPSELSRVFNKMIKKIGVTPIRFHDLRHTHATLMLEQGIHPKIVSERLGHSNIGITLDTYSHVLPNMQEEAANKFDQLIKIK